MPDQTLSTMKTKLEMMQMEVSQMEVSDGGVPDGGVSDGGASDRKWWFQQDGTSVRVSQHQVFKGFQSLSRFFDSQIGPVIIMTNFFG